uniref:Diguanylate cyclase n=1 Tax=Desertifilum tharense IPPAS B-1220 TaxID=1781255 RepID=A0ACD5H1J5_9CYAN
MDIDSLTQLANRRSLDRYLAINWQQSAGMGTSLALILLDVDDFKAYNDTYGHPAGDRCLRQIAGVIHSHQRSPDLVARYGGEEFAIVLPQTNAKEATELAEKMRVAIKSLAIPHENSKTGQGIVTVSIGVACVVSCLGSDCSVLLLAADKALYHSKHQGRDLVTLSEAIATSL